MSQLVLYIGFSMSEEEVEALASQLEKDLLQMYGSPILSGSELQKAMGYKTIDALRQAVVRKTIPIAVFTLPNRRGTHALVKDIAIWLAENARKNEEKK